MKIYMTVLLFVTGISAIAQNYDPHVLFSPEVYPQGINEYRNSAGEPGPSYWQNKADYQIDAALDESKNEIKATVVITYKNNSPQSLSSIWMILEQDLFNQQSRGFAKTPVQGRSRYDDSKSIFQGG